LHDIEIIKKERAAGLQKYSLIYPVSNVIFSELFIQAFLLCDS
jgi:hypothetical protein